VRSSWLRQFLVRQFFRQAIRATDARNRASYFVGSGDGSRPGNDPLPASTDASFGLSRGFDDSQFPVKGTAWRRAEA